MRVNVCFLVFLYCRSSSIDNLVQEEKTDERKKTMKSSKSRKRRDERCVLEQATFLDNANSFHSPSLKKPFRIFLV